MINIYTEKKKTITVICLIGLFQFWLLCCNMISPGYVGVVVSLLGEDKGVSDKPVGVGMCITPPWKQVYTFPTFEQNTTWEGTEGFSFQTIEGMAISADIGITYHLESDAIPVIFQKYRRGMREITNVFIYNYVRDSINKAASRFSIEHLYSDGKERFFDEVEKDVRKHLDLIGIKITRIYLIGRFHFPDNVIKALNSKIEANQRAQQRENELREAEAEAKKQVAQSEGAAKCIMQKAKAEAEANILLAKSVTSELIQWQSIQKWNGSLPQVTGGSMPFVNIK